MPRNTHHVGNLVAGKGNGGGLGESGERRFQARCRGVWRDEPKHCVGSGEGLIDDIGVTVRADHYVDAFALPGLRGWMGRV